MFTNQLFQTCMTRAAARVKSLVKTIRSQVELGGGYKHNSCENKVKLSLSHFTKT